MFDVHPSQMMRTVEASAVQISPVTADASPRSTQAGGSRSGRMLVSLLDGKLDETVCLLVSGFPDADRIDQTARAA
jgi:hypothetical protein